MLPYKAKVDTCYHRKVNVDSCYHTRIKMKSGSILPYKAEEVENILHTSRELIELCEKISAEPQGACAGDGLDGGVPLLLDDRVVLA